MKKLLFIAIAFIGLSVSAQEENKEAIKNAEISAMTTAKSIAATVGLEDSESINKVREIITEKEVTLARHADLSDDRKESVKSYTVNSLKKVLTQEQFGKLTANEELYNKIIAME